MAVLKAVHSNAKLSVAIAYITKKEKTEERLVTGIQCSPGSAVAEMETTKRLWRKTGGRQYDHYIQSFAPGEPVTPAVAHRIACQWAEHQFPGHECVVATHVDRDHVHSHVIVNSVSFETGRKLHTSAHWLQEAKDYSDLLCERSGLSICQKGKTYDGQQREDATSWSKEQYQLLEKASQGEAKSFLVEIAVAIATVLKVAMSREDFVQKLLDLGVSTTWTDKRKYITFSDLEGNKVRNSKLEKNFHVDFSKEALTHEFENRSREAQRSASPSKPQPDGRSAKRTGAEPARPQQRQEDAPLSLAQRLEEAAQELERRSRLQGCPPPRQSGRGSAVRSDAQPVPGQQQQDDGSLSLAQRLEDARRALEGRDHSQQPAQRKGRQDLDR